MSNKLPVYAGACPKGTCIGEAHWPHIPGCRNMALAGGTKKTIARPGGGKNDILIDSHVSDD